MEGKKVEWIVGLMVRIKTSLGEEVEGEIFSFDANTNCVILFDILLNQRLILVALS